MTTFWKALVVCLALYSAVLTGVTLKLSSYVIRLHFDCGSPERTCRPWYSHTAPLRESVILLAVVLALLLVVCVVAGRNKPSSRGPRGTR